MAAVYMKIYISAPLPSRAAGDILVRYTRALSAAWAMRKSLTPQERIPLERQFLPAALEIIDTPAPALPHAIILTISAAFGLAILWATLGRVDMVTIAPGRIIAAGKAKVIQPAETAVVKRILAGDGNTDVVKFLARGRHPAGLRQPGAGDGHAIVGATSLKIQINKTWQ